MLASSDLALEGLTMVSRAAITAVECITIAPTQYQQWDLAPDVGRLWGRHVEKEADPVGPPRVPPRPRPQRIPRMHAHLPGILLGEDDCLASVKHCDRNAPMPSHVTLCGENALNIGIQVYISGGDSDEIT